MRIESVSVGGWFQRTTLHLEEVFNFISSLKNPPFLDYDKINKLRKSLDIVEYSMNVGYFDLIEFKTTEGIVVKIFEDGLITLSLSDYEKEISEITNKLTLYYEKKLSPRKNFLRQ